MAGVQIINSYFSQKNPIKWIYNPWPMLLFSAIDSKDCIASVVKNGHRGDLKKVKREVMIF